ncbi:hypothetical protein [Cupriavidus metallidurans]|uniref:hypothetical protein n=1 Tax=Cupriavidus metallidurans TaxID=119219 RepID=UPI001BFC5BDF|nr:hypothetical protein [Cupriavidus metallidurans]QWC90927.1 hypothetical protein KB891_25805 [Cupriavidus metallidurans]
MKPEPLAPARFAVSADAGGDPLRVAPALRQWREVLMQQLSRLPATGASIDTRHGLLLQLARCELDLRAMLPSAFRHGARSR